MNVKQVKRKLDNGATIYVCIDEETGKQVYQAYPGAPWTFEEPKVSDEMLKRFSEGN